MILVVEDDPQVARLIALVLQRHGRKCEIVADGPTADVVVSSPVFAPQVAKVMHPARWLTVAQVTAALATEEVR